MRYYLLLLSIFSLAQAALPPPNVVRGIVASGYGKRDPAKLPIGYVNESASLHRRQDEINFPGLTKAQLRLKQATEPFNPAFVSKATHPIPLWFDRLPNYQEIDQRNISNCWTQAATLAITLVSPDWITRLFYYKDGNPVSGSVSPNVSEVDVMLWAPDTRQYHKFPANVYNQSLTEDVPGDRWWSSAILQGLVQLAGITNIPGINGNNATVKMEGGDTVAALSALTGYPAMASWDGVYSGTSSEDQLYDDLIKASKWATPIVIATKQNNTAGNHFKNSILHGNHAYAVHNAQPVDPRINDPNAVRTIRLRNPWAITIEANMTDILENMKRVVHLTDFRDLNWANVIAQQAAGTNSAARWSISTAASQATTSAIAPPRRRRRRSQGRST